MEGDAEAPDTLSELHTISIHALRVEGDTHFLRGDGFVLISIHALRVEGDALGVKRNVIEVWISIHALRVEGDLCVVVALQ